MLILIAMQHCDENFRFQYSVQGKLSADIFRWKSETLEIFSKFSNHFHPQDEKDFSFISKS